MKEPLFSMSKKDFEITWFSGKGAGGQHRNKHQNCCRIKHIETGIMTTGQNYREREKNKREAFFNLTNKEEFKKWLKLKSSKETLSREELEKQIDQMMSPVHLKVECFKDGRWQEMELVSAFSVERRGKK